MGDGKIQRAAIGIGDERGAGALDDFKRAGNVAEITPGGLGRDQALLVADEERQSQLCLKALDQAADRALRQAQFLRRPGDRSRPHHRVKGQKQAEIGQKAPLSQVHSSYASTDENYPFCDAL